MILKYALFCAPHVEHTFLRGFIIIPRSGDEIIGFQKTLALQALTEDIGETKRADDAHRAADF